MLGKEFGPLRLPLCEMDFDKKEKLRNVLESYGLF